MTSERLSNCSGGLSPVRGREAPCAPVTKLAPGDGADKRPTFGSLFYLGEGGTMGLQTVNRKSEMKLKRRKKPIFAQELRAGITARPALRFPGPSEPE